jgi:putative hemolysin
LGRVSQTQEFVDCAGWRFRVIAMDGKRIDKIIAQVYVPDV